MVGVDLFHTDGPLPGAYVLKAPLCSSFFHIRRTFCSHSDVTVCFVFCVLTLGLRWGFLTPCVIRMPN